MYNNSLKIEELRYPHIVIGSGAAGLAAALRLARGCSAGTAAACKIPAVALITENMSAGTSRNTGSDKQTYYKLSLASSDPDSTRAMASDLFAGGAVDGDLALCEAALSARGFYSLVELGVPFPSTEYGESMGYKTDHDRGRRATSAGPYTSKLMTEALERAVRRENIALLEGLTCIRLLVRDGRIYGVLCVKARNGSAAEPASPYVIVWCGDAVLAAGGPAGMYRDSVYPQSQLGMSGMAFEAGAAGRNLTEWQFGMASLKPRWNVSGTYMQVLPRFVSTDRDGGGEREFLNDYYENPGEMLTNIFLKGYQWPFDSAKTIPASNNSPASSPAPNRSSASFPAPGGGPASSVIDLLVYRETVLRGRRVFLDFTRNPSTKAQGSGADPAAVPFELLSEEAYSYLRSAGALTGTPIDRLRIMNAPAVSFYLEHGVDLSKDRLEIAVCAQHNNGGLAVDADWQTEVEGLYAVGEIAGTHGVTRPGGSALNAGQVGAIRASEAILRRERIQRRRADSEEVLRTEAEDFSQLPESAVGDRSLAAMWKDAQARMSAAGGMIRNRESIVEALEAAEATIRNFAEIAARPEPGQLALFYRLRDMLLSQKVYLSAMLDYIDHGGGSRGSALYTDPEGELPGSRQPVPALLPDGPLSCGPEPLPGLFRLRPDRGEHSGVIQEIRLARVGCEVTWRPVRPIPEVDYFFENQWRAYRERNGISR